MNEPIDQIQSVLKTNNIKQVTLFFPHGADPKKIDEAMRAVQNIVGFRVSSGGYTPMDRYMTTFSDEMMTYDFGYEMKAKS